MSRPQLVPLAPATVSAAHDATLRREAHCACGGGCPGCREEQQLQPKLHVSRAGDALEQEADRAAEQVLGTASVDDSLTARRAEGSSLRITRHASGAGAPGVPPIVHDVLRSAGEPLDSRTRDFMEPRFGYDFGGVRVHTDARAAESARAVEALAYTVGRDVVFAAGQYAPGTTAGRRLLAHELAHVLQSEIAAGTPAVMRYESYEHQDLGDAHLQNLREFLQTDEGRVWARRLGLSGAELAAQIANEPMLRDEQGRAVIRTGGRERVAADRGERMMTLTPGQIISLMGDFYGSWVGLADAPAAEVGGILDIMRRERFHQLSSSQAALAYQQITHGRYLDLASRNAAHFATMNRREWRRLHEEALAEARLASQSDRKAHFQRALFIDAAAGHFLTDAFAAGHLLDRARVLTEIRLYLREHPIRTENPQMQAYAALITAKGNAPDLVLKNIHDRMNREGFMMTNARGMRWRTFGDAALAQAPETQRIAALAVFLSRQQVRQAYRTGVTPDPAEVEAFMPDERTVERATEQAISYIPQAAREVENLIYRTRALASAVLPPVLGPVAEFNLSNTNYPGRERGASQLLELPLGLTLSARVGGAQVWLQGGAGLAPLLDERILPEDPARGGGGAGAVIGGGQLTVRW